MESIQSAYDSVVAPNCTGRGLQRVGSAEERTACLDSFTTLPDHGHDWTAKHICDHSLAVYLVEHGTFRGRTGDKTLVERLVREILVMLLQVLFRRSDHFQRSELVPVETLAAEERLGEAAYPRFSKRQMMSPTRPRYR